MSLVSFKRGLKNNLPSSGISDGELYLTTDTGELFAAGTSNSLTKVSDIVICTTESDLPTAGTEISTKLYYVTATNSLYKVKSGDWEPLGSDIFAEIYTAGTGIDITSANVINHTNSITAGSSSQSSGQLIAGGTLTLPAFTYDAQGHITNVTTSDCTLPTGSGTGSVTSVAAGVGLATASGSAITTSGTVKAKVTSETPLDIDAVTAASTGTSGRLYPVQIDNSGYLAVNVPWTDNGGVTSVNGQTGAVTLSASDVSAIASSDKGANNGVASLGSDGKVPSAQLPSYVDDVIEGYYNDQDGKFYEESTYITEITGETGKVYVSLDTNKTYRWSGSVFVIIGGDLALGETSTTAYAGDKGKANADAITAIKNGVSINSFGGVETALGNKYDTSDSAETTLDDADYVPFYDTSATAKKKTLWSNIKSVLKSYFDTIYLTTHQDISGKADKVISATNGNFAGLDSNGNLIDSGSKASDFLTSHQDISGKADKVISATNGNFAGLDSNGNLTDSGHSHSDYLQSGKVVLAVNPTDTTFMTTPGAIWIET